MILLESVRSVVWRRISWPSPTTVCGMVFASPLAGGSSVKSTYWLDLIWSTIFLGNDCRPLPRVTMLLAVLLWLDCCVSRAYIVLASFCTVGFNIVGGLLLAMSSENSWMPACCRDSVSGSCSVRLPRWDNTMTLVFFVLFIYFYNFSLVVVSTCFKLWLVFWLMWQPISLNHTLCVYTCSLFPEGGPMHHVYLGRVTQHRQ